ncbi:MAG: serine--tRNA ligase [Alphaproteobacteria bacterium]|nr:serine--tRNA ligase [Alphaproteobacteria bacterium]
MLDLKWIRENPDEFDAAMQKRDADFSSESVLVLDKQVRDLQTEIQSLQAEGNAIAKDIPAALKRGEDIAAIKEQGKKIKENIADKSSSAEAVQQRLKSMLDAIPNIPDAEVVVGADENDNVEIRKWGNKPSFDFAAKMHDDIGVALGLLDFEIAAKISGSRFVVLKGQLARLERALAAFFLDHNTQKFAFEEVIPPFLVRDAALYGSGQLPKFEEDLFKVTTDHYMIPTAEVPLVNLVADTILSDEDLPIRYTAYTPCFRSEAGSAGRDTRGMIRQHQFSKVEMISITSQENSALEHERMTECAESLLQALNIHYRVVSLCTGDLGFAAHKTYDLEAWMPGQDAYREISSCSNCGDFQARRMKARYRVKGEKTNQFVHTLNGSALPIGRTMVAIIENYQQADGSIAVPEVLQPYMGGVQVIGGKK